MLAQQRLGKVKNEALVELLDDDEVRPDQSEEGPERVGFDRN